MPTANNEFEVAKTIAQALEGLEKEQQLRVLRWVSESIGLSATPSPSPAYAPPPPGPSAAPTAPHMGAVPTATNIKSFVEQKKPKTDVQFAAVVAYFYRFEAPVDQRLQAITSETLVEATRLANRGRLQSPNKTLNNAKRQGYLDTADRGAFKINSVGENLVAMTLPGGGDTGSTPKRNKAGKKKSASKVGPAK